MSLQTQKRKHARYSKLTERGYTPKAFTRSYNTTTRGNNQEGLYLGLVEWQNRPNYAIKL